MINQTAAFYIDLFVLVILLILDISYISKTNIHIFILFSNHLFQLLLLSQLFVSSKHLPHLALPIDSPLPQDVAQLVLRYNWWRTWCSTIVRTLCACFSHVPGERGGNRLLASPS